MNVASRLMEVAAHHDAKLAMSDSFRLEAERGGGRLKTLRRLDRPVRNPNSRPVRLAQRLVLAQRTGEELAERIIP